MALVAVPAAASFSPSVSPPFSSNPPNIPFISIPLSPPPTPPPLPPLPLPPSPLTDQWRARLRKRPDAAGRRGEAFLLPSPRWRNDIG
ncbi:unnamed protein product [Closterium sp. NIES-54]